MSKRFSRTKFGRFWIQFFSSRPVTSPTLESPLYPTILLIAWYIYIYIYIYIYRERERERERNSFSKFFLSLESLLRCRNHFIGVWFLYFLLQSSFQPLINLFHFSSIRKEKSKPTEEDAVTPLLFSVSHRHSIPINDLRCEERKTSGGYDGVKRMWSLK